MKIHIQCDQWLPDRGASEAACQDVENIVPCVNGWQSLSSPQMIHTFPHGSVTGYYNDGKGLEIIGSQTGIWQYKDGNWQRLYESKSKLPKSQRWTFHDWENMPLAHHESGLYLRFDETCNDYVIVKEAPKAKYMAVIHDFVVMGHLYDEEEGEHMVQWSQMNHSEAFTEGENQADSQVLNPDFGSIQAICGGQDGKILTDKGIIHLTYQGHPYIWTLQFAHQGYGCVHGRTVHHCADRLYYLSPKGFIECKHKTLRLIGRHRIDNFFLHHFQDTMVNYMFTAYDEQEDLMCWSFLDKDGQRMILAYSITFDRWTKLILPHEALYLTSLNGKNRLYLNNEKGQGFRLTGPAIIGKMITQLVEHYPHYYMLESVVPLPMDVDCKMKLILDKGQKQYGTRQHKLNPFYFRHSRQVHQFEIELREQLNPLRGLTLLGYEQFR